MNDNNDTPKVETNIIIYECSYFNGYSSRLCKIYERKVCNHKSNDKDDLCFVFFYCVKTINIRFLAFTIVIRLFLKRENKENE